MFIMRRHVLCGSIVHLSAPHAALDFLVHTYIHVLVILYWRMVLGVIRCVTSNIANSAVQSSARVFFHNAILFIDIFNNA